VEIPPRTPTITSEAIDVATSQKQGPNVKRLICHKMALLMIPVSTPEGQGFATGIKALTEPGNIGKVAREATAWVDAAIRAIKVAREPNPWKDKDDEAIAGDLLAKIEQVEN
jgi:hypothetical protein